MKILQKTLAGLAAGVIKKKKPKIIGITGSVGKTSVKEAIAAVLRTKFGNKLGYSHGNLNNEIGLPLAILGFKDVPSFWQWPMVLLRAWLRSLGWRYFGLDYFDVLVLEYAADKPGDIQYLLRIARPNVAVLTKIGSAHLQAFEGLEKILEEKSALLRGVTKDGWVVINQLAPQFHQLIKDVPVKKVFYKISEDVEPAVFAKTIAKTVGEVFAVSQEKINEALMSFQFPAGRLRVLPGINQTTLIDDTYNANPLSATVAVDFLAAYGNKHHANRKIAVLGDMLELGLLEKTSHREIGEIAKKKVDLLVAVGQRAKEMVGDQWFLTPMETSEFLLKEIKKGDIILIKGSQGMRMEKVTEVLLADKSMAKDVLVRQSVGWKRKPFTQP